MPEPLAPVPSQQMICQAHLDCLREVVAKVGLPGPHALWVCQEGFYEYEGNPRCRSLVGVGGLQCRLRAAHVLDEGAVHQLRTTRWSVRAGEAEAVRGMLDGKGKLFFPDSRFA